MFVGRKAGHFSANFLFVVALLVTYLNLKDVWCKTQRFNHQVDFQRDWCPGKSFKVYPSSNYPPMNNVGLFSCREL
jgi:hypothetical protein